jgi:signal recognition particle GTPase
MLDSVMNKFTNSIKIQLLLSKVNKDFVKDFIKNIKENPGNAKLKLFFRDNDEILEMTPKKNKVSPDSFVKYLNDNKDLKFKLS